MQKDVKGASKPNNPHPEKQSDNERPQHLAATLKKTCCSQQSEPMRLVSTVT
jgi:hypothetical protein